MSDDKPIVPDSDLYVATDLFTPEDWHSETTSIASSLYRGFQENGRRYQTLKDGDSYVPSDERQFEAYEAGHVTALVMDSHRDNPLFRAPVGPNPQHILDLGTGQGSWAIDVADMLPRTTVRGVDLFPPPVSWTPPNCIFEVDDVLQEWTWANQFDLVHMRILDAAFTYEERDKLYDNCYKNIRPGGWIEQLELSPMFLCDDDSVPQDALVNGWADTTMKAAINFGRPLDLYYQCDAHMKKAGFIDIRVTECKWPVGPWARDKQLKEAGAMNLEHWSASMDGYGMFLLTKFAEPMPWSKEEVLVYTAQLRKELSNPAYHIYHKARRVWARKPFDEPKIKQESPEATTQTLIDPRNTQEARY